jgi:hypothetical protein
MRKRVLGGILVAGLFTRSALGTTTFYTWTGGAGDELWSNPANWSPSGVPDASSDVTLDAAKASSTTLDLGGGTWAASELRFSNTAQGTPFLITDGILDCAGIASAQTDAQDTISAGLTTSTSSFLIGTYRQPLLISGIIGGNGVGRNDFSVYINSTYLTPLEGPVFTNANTYTGTTYIGSSNLKLSGATGSIQASAAIRLDTGTITIDNSTASNNDRIGDTAPILLGGGSSIAVIGNALAASTEIVGDVTLSGGNQALQAYSGGAFATLQMNSLSRSVGQTLTVLLSDGSATPSGRLLVSHPASLGLVGGGGVSNNPNISILPYAKAQDGTFVTYDPGPDGIAGNSDDVGLRPLNVTTEYATSIPDGIIGTLNVRLDGKSQTISNATAVDALAMNNASVSIGQGKQLTINSGAITLSTSSASMAAFSGPGALAFPSGEAIIYTNGAGGPARYVLDAPISGSTHLTKSGTGTLVLTQANPFTGVDITDGMLVSQAQGALGTGTIMIGGVSGGLIFEGVSQTVPGQVVFGGPGTPERAFAETISVASGLRVDLTGGVSQDNLVKAGNGYLHVSGTSGYGVGWIYVDAGLLRLDTNISPLQIQVSAPGTLAGQINAFAIYGSGTVWPGAGLQSGASTITASDFAGGLNYKFNIDGSSAGLYDQLIVTTGIDLSGTLDLNRTYSPSLDTQFTIIDNQSWIRTEVGGTFAGLPEGATFWSGDDEFQITYQGGDGNDVVLTVVSTPEPSAIFGVGACAAVGLLCRRRRWVG